jgi:hypothetical protein
MRRPGVLAALLAVVAAGCSSPQPSLYTLERSAGTPDERALAPVVVREVNVARYLDRPQIVTHRTAYELAYSDTERWGEPLDEMVPRVLTEDLTQRLPATRIAGAASGMVPEAERILIVNIDRFDADPDGTVVLEARWAVRTEQRAGTFEKTRITVRAASTHAADLVAAMSTGLGQLGDQLAAAIAAAR